MRKVRLSILIGVVVFSLAHINSSIAQTNIYKLHSLFVYNFVKNIKWEHVGNEFVIGIYNNPAVHKEFSKNFINKSISGIPFTIREISTSSEASACQIVYLPRANRTKTKALIDELQSDQILVVTEEDLVQEGASISFELVGSKLNFKINKQETDKKGLKISSSLLALGTVI